MPTVAEILKQTGMSDESIALIDAKALAAFSGVLTTAEEKERVATEASLKAEQERQAASLSASQAEKERKDAVAQREAAELAQRSNVEFYETKIMPALNGWDEQKLSIEKARIKAESEAAFYRTQAEAAKTAGFIPNEAPGFTPPEQKEAPKGGYVANAPGSTPGSPSFLDPNVIAQRIGDAAKTLTDIDWEYRSLYGTPMPIPPSQLIAEADAQKLDPRAYAEKRFGFTQKKQEISLQQQQERDAKLTADAVAPYEKRIADEKSNYEKLIAQKEREWAESGGSNPDARKAIPSQNIEISRAVKTGERPDPLLLNDNQRHNITRKQIQDRISSENVA